MGPSLVNCRACGSSDLFRAFDLGNLAISDFLKFDQSDSVVFDKSPLELWLCRDCSLVQLGQTVDRDRLYRHYHYESGIQESMVNALKDVVVDARRYVDLKDGDAWLDIGANDGTLLGHVPLHVRCFAFEPAENLWPKLQHNGVIMGRYFPPSLDNAQVSIDEKFKVITSVACFYDVEDPNLFVAAIKDALDKDGVWVNQMAYLPATLATNNFGDVCHEHITYWTSYAFQRLLAAHDLRIVATTFNDVNGGSFRTVVRHGSDVAWSSDRVGPIALRRFKQRIDLHRSQVRAFLHDAKRDGEMVMGYGASTKGNTYLQYWSVGNDLMMHIADRNPDKWDACTPTGQRVISEEEMRKFNPHYLFVLPWHFADAFIERERAYLEAGGKMVIPFPEFRVIDADSLKTRTQTAVGAVSPT